MTDFINRQDAIDAFYRRADDEGYIVLLVCDVEELLNSLPERTPGEWIPDNDRPKSYRFRCSECGGVAYFIGGGLNRCGYKYCPNCGSYNGGENDRKG